RVSDGAPARMGHAYGGPARTIRKRTRSRRPRSGPPRRVQLVCLRREDEVVVMESVDLVRPGLHQHATPGQVHVGMVALAFGQLADLDREVERLPEVLEAVLPRDACDALHLGHLPLRHL